MLPRDRIASLPVEPKTPHLPSPDPGPVPGMAGLSRIRDRLPLPQPPSFGHYERLSRHHLYLTQRFARHSSPLTTTIYTHVSDEELYTALRGIKT
jgi:hypothetical protein